MTPRVTLLATLLAALSLFALGHWAGSGQVRTVTVERVVYQDRQEDVKATRDEARFATKVQTVTKPDGTVVVTRRTEAVKVAERVESATTEKAQTTQRVVQADSRKAQYRLSVQVKPSDTSDVRVGLGRRLLGPVWGEVSATRKGEFTLGLGIEF